jgi:hypothetical protein
MMYSNECTLPKFISVDITVSCSEGNEMQLASYSVVEDKS